MTPDLLDYVSFRGEKLTLVWREAEPFVAVRPICERLGLAWGAQHRKLTKHGTVFNRPHMSTVQTPKVLVLTGVGADEKQRDMLCLHALYLPLWLATISAAKVREDLREAVITYQDEAALALFNHIKARLLGEAAKNRDLGAKVGMDLLYRKPLWVRVHGFCKLGWDFEKIWRACNTTRPRLAEAVAEMVRLGIITAAPAGTPLTGSQLDMFPPTPVDPLPGIDEMIERSMG